MPLCAGATAAALSCGVVSGLVSSSQDLPFTQYRCSNGLQRALSSLTVFILVVVDITLFISAAWISPSELILIPFVAHHVRVVVHRFRLRKAQAFCSSSYVCSVLLLLVGAILLFLHPTQTVAPHQHNVQNQGTHRKSLAHDTAERHPLRSTDAWNPRFRTFVWGSTILMITNETVRLLGGKPNVYFARATAAILGALSCVACCCVSHSIFGRMSQVPLSTLPQVLSHTLKNVPSRSKAAFVQASTAPATLFTSPLAGVVLLLSMMILQVVAVKRRTAKELSRFSVANAYYFLLAMFTVVGSFAWDNVDLGAEFTLRNVSSQLIAAAVLSASLVLHSYERRPLDHDTEHWPQFVPTGDAQIQWALTFPNVISSHMLSFAIHRRELRKQTTSTAEHRMSGRYHNESAAHRFWRRLCCPRQKKAIIYARSKGRSRESLPTNDDAHNRPEEDIVEDAETTPLLRRARPSEPLSL